MNRMISKQYHSFPAINRNVLVIEPTEVFLEWAKKNPDKDVNLTLKELIEDAAAYLIPEQEAGPEAWLKRNFKTIFEIELDGWCADPSLWPEDRSLKTFKKFFKIYFSSYVIDLAEGEILREYI